MAALLRVTVDIVVEEELSERRMAVIARETTDYVHTIVMEQDDQCHKEVDKNATCHLHDTASGDRCPICVEESLDYKNGDTVLAG